MTTISDLIETAETSYGNALEVRYLYPTLYVICSSEEFGNLDSDQRDRLFTSALSMEPGELDRIRGLGVIEIVLCSPSQRKAEYGFLDHADAGHHWLEWFNPLLWKNKKQALPSQEKTTSISDSSTKALHFYGYKGGQARSTVLLLMAKKLAENGQRVLVVDADIEAPSLDAMLDVTTEFPEATLMGLCGWATEITPVARAYVGHSSTGTVDVLACRPKSPSYDMDFAAFTLGTALDARTLERAIKKLREFVSQQVSPNRYDIVMFDHRTGMTPSVLPIMQSWPGPALIFVRPDGMARPGEVSNIFRTLLSQDSTTPGAFVSFSLDPKEVHESARRAHGRFIDQLLTTISDALTRDGEQEDIDPSELEDYWALWHHDTALLHGNRVAPSNLSSANQKTLEHLIDLLDVQKVAPSILPNNTPLNLMISGATDEGWFILTPDIARLFSKESPIRYVFGRKGTGKTRLLRELHVQKLGEPLLVATDYQEGGLQSAGIDFIRLYEICGKNSDHFWWTLLYAALDCSNTDGNALSESIKKITKNPGFNGAESVRLVDALLSNAKGERTFLIDGVETAVPAPELRSFVEGLFRFMAAVQYDRNMASKLKIRLFLRSDLWQGASQNIEQQVEGVALVLRWDKTSILNFALGRMASLPWFRQTFTAVCALIEGQKDQIARGALSDELTESLLLNVFPKSLDRNKLKTTTFFSTYFSDAGGDSEARASFYPRLFDAFLKGVDALASEAGADRALKDERLVSSIVLKAYDEASGTFINEVRHELYTLLALNDSASENKQIVDLLIGSFSGQKTPFEPEELVAALAIATEIEPEKVRDALHRMKAMGIFENSPGSRSVWRTGRLYKSGLKMKYVRSNTAKR